MVDHREPFFLFIGHGDSEAATSKLKVSNILYKKKLLESHPENWLAIGEMLQDENLVGVLVKLNRNTCKMLVSDEYAESAGRLLSSLSKMRHIVFMHESVLADPVELLEGLEDPGEDVNDYREWWQKSHFDDHHAYDSRKIMQQLTEQEGNVFYWLQYGHTLGDSVISLATIRAQIPSILAKLKECVRLPTEARLRVRELIIRHNLNLVLYLSADEWSTAAAAFIEDNDKKLLFRVYVPSGRIFSTEAEKLFALFCGWLSQVKGRRIRRGGYRTNQGQVYEFYGDSELAGQNLSTELNEFADFLELCVNEPGAALQILGKDNVEHAIRNELVARYAKEGRRLQLDLKHQWESRILSLRQQFQSEVLENSHAAEDASVLVDMLLPPTSGLVNTILYPSFPDSHSVAAPTVQNIVVNQQIIGTAQGVIAQKLSGTVALGAEATQLLTLVNHLGGADKHTLESAVYELEDQDARHLDRVTAKQRLKGFLFKVGSKVGDGSIAVLQKYIESKIGL